MKWIAIILLSIIIALTQTNTARAELAYETIDNIQVPSSVLWGVQGEWQGHIVYSVRPSGSGYEIKVARDGEPHQYPYFYVAFDSNWTHIGTTKHVDPAALRQ